MANLKKSNYFTEGAIFSKIIMYSLPIILTNLLQTFYTTADMIAVSLSSEENAVGAIGTTSSFISLLLNVFIGFTSGISVLVAKSIGAKDKEKTQNAVHTALAISFLFGVAGAVVGLVLSRPILVAMGNSGNLLDLSLTYTYIYFVGLPFMSVSNSLFTIFRAKGDSRNPTVFSMVSGVLNVILNFIFVLVFKTSVEGVALATAISKITTTTILIIKLSKDDDYTRFSFKKLLKIDVKSMKEILYIGFPAGIQGSLFSIASMIVQSSIITVNNSLVAPGTKYQPIVSGNSVGSNIDNFVYMAMNAVYMSTLLFTSHNVGAKNYKRIIKIMWNAFLAVTLIGVLFSSIVLLLQNPLIKLYGLDAKTTDELQKLAVITAKKRLLYFCIPYFLYGCMEVSMGMLRGLGKSLTLTFISLMGTCVLRIIWIATVFRFIPTLDIIYISFPITWIVTLACLFITILLELKKRINNSSATE